MIGTGYVDHEPSAALRRPCASIGHAWSRAAFFLPGLLRLGWGLVVKRHVSGIPFLHGSFFEQLEVVELPAGSWFEPLFEGMRLNESRAV